MEKQKLSTCEEAAINGQSANRDNLSYIAFFNQTFFSSAFQFIKRPTAEQHWPGKTLPDVHMLSLFWKKSTDSTQQHKLPDSHINSNSVNIQVLIHFLFDLQIWRM